MSTNTPTGRPAVGYVRVSTEEQAREGVSLDVQRQRIASAAAAHGLVLSDVLADEGISGRRSDNRPGLLRAVDLACERRAALVVYSLSRFARSTRDCLAMAERLTAAGADLISVSESIDTTAAHGKFLFTLLSALAQLESDQTSERTRAAVAHKRACGERTGSVPYGHRVAADGVHLEPNPAEQAQLDRLVDLRLAGHSYPAVQRVAAAEGIRNRAGGPLPLKRVHELVVRHAADRGVDVRLAPEAVVASRLAGLAKSRDVQRAGREARLAAAPRPRPKLRPLAFPRTLALVLDGRQTETRRPGWRDLRAGDRLAAVERVGSAARGEIEVLAVHRERLSRVTRAGVRREGFATWTPEEYAAYYLSTAGAASGDPEVTVIRFRRVDG